eukprot:SAG11_NODE_812_length_7059_cov_5.203017_5_plen_82_part_00
MRSRGWCVGHETPDTVQWETMCGALKCVAAEGITLSAFIRLYEGEGPHNDYYTLEDQGLIDEVQSFSAHSLVDAQYGPTAH